MNKLFSILTAVMLTGAITGCGDGSVEVRTRNTTPNNPVVIEKPSETTTKKEVKTETKSDGTEVKTKETTKTTY
jgi:hypothetical protein